MIINQTKKFQKALKKLHKNQREDLYNAIKQLLKDPYLGRDKVGDLAGIRGYKFKMVNQESLLAYIYADDIETLTLLVFSTHENFY